MLLAAGAAASSSRRALLAVACAAAPGRRGAAAAAASPAARQQRRGGGRAHRAMDAPQQPAPAGADGRGGPPKKTFTIAVEGCCHGELDNIYATLAHLERAEGRKVDLLICCGDFQAVRNLDDLETMSVPVKYRQLMTFWKYYSGAAVAPVPTLFIGGNHEATNYLWELHYGGWAAPNIYFLGYSGAVRFGGHRIAGLSGTFVAPHFGWGHHEALPYDERCVKSAYHVRALHVHRLMQLREPTSVFLSHDWPNLITRHGNAAWLFKKKPYFQKEAERGDLGSPPNQALLEALQPDYYFAAHLHVKFPAVVRHGGGAGGGVPGAAQPAPGAEQQQQQQQQQQQAAAAGAGQQQAAAGAGGGERVTRFLALDKCLPGRDFLQVVELEARGPLELSYDAEWLAVLRSTHGLMSTSKHAPPLPPDWGGRAGPAPEDVAHVERLLSERGSAAIPHNFAPTAPAFDPVAGRVRGAMPRSDLRNPQTVALLDWLGLPYNLDHAANARGGGGGGGGGWARRPAVAAAGAGPAYAAPRGLLSQQQGGGGGANPEEINIDSDSDGGGGGGAPAAAAAPAALAAADAFEIALDDDDDDDDGGGDGDGAGAGGALADGAPDSDADAGGGGGDGGADGDAGGGRDDDPMFGVVDTARFPYYTST
ncbi:DBR1 [Scenedesmus sp. PABB004]|nr:DBR1 [Scenedesmus sp. PABB004]